MNEPHVQTRRSTLDHNRIDYARTKMGQGYPLSAVARMVGSCEADLRRLVVKPPPPPEPVLTPEEKVLSGLPPAAVEIIRQVSEARDIPVTRIMNPFDRKAPVTRARQEVMWTIYELRQADSGLRRFSTTSIARILNIRCHSSVSTGARAHAKRLAAQ